MPEPIVFIRKKSFPASAPFTPRWHPTTIAQIGALYQHMIQDIERTAEGRFFLIVGMQFMIGDWNDAITSASVLEAEMRLTVTFSE